MDPKELCIVYFSRIQYKCDTVIQKDGKLSRKDSKPLLFSQNAFIVGRENPQVILDYEVYSVYPKPRPLVDILIHLDFSLRVISLQVFSIALGLEIDEPQ